MVRLGRLVGSVGSGGLGSWSGRGGQAGCMSPPRKCLEMTNLGVSRGFGSGFGLISGQKAAKEAEMIAGVGIRAGSEVFSVSASEGRLHGSFQECV